MFIKSSVVLNGHYSHKPVTYQPLSPVNDDLNGSPIPTVSAANHNLADSNNKKTDDRRVVPSLAAEGQPQSAHKSKHDTLLRNNLNHNLASNEVLRISPGKQRQQQNIHSLNNFRMNYSKQNTPLQGGKSCSKATPNEHHDQQVVLTSSPLKKTASSFVGGSNGSRHHTPQVVHLRLNQKFIDDPIEKTNESLEDEDFLEGQDQCNSNDQSQQPQSTNKKCEVTNLIHQRSVDAQAFAKGGNLIGGSSNMLMKVMGYNKPAQSREATNNSLKAGITITNGLQPTNTGVFGLRKSSNIATTNIDKSQTSSTRQTPQSQLTKRANLKSAQGFGDKSSIYKSTKQLLEHTPSSTTNDDSTPASFTTASSKIAVVQSSQPFSQVRHQAPIPYNKHTRKQSQSAHAASLHQKHKKTILTDSINQTLSDKESSSIEVNTTLDDMTGISKNIKDEKFNILSENNSIDKGGRNSTAAVQSLLHAQKKAHSKQNQNQALIGGSAQKKRKKSMQTKKPSVVINAPYISSSNNPYANASKFVTPKESSNKKNKDASGIGRSCGQNAFLTQNNCAQTYEAKNILREQIMNIQLRQSQRNNSSNGRQQQNAAVMTQENNNNQTLKKLQQNKAPSFAHPAMESVKKTSTPAAGNQNSIPQKKKQWQLMDSEKQQYGDRVPQGYEKLDLLGKGGCALVWLAKNQKTNETVALKQFPKQKSQIDQTAKVEVQFGRTLFPKNSSTGKTNYALDPKQYPGIKHIAKLIDDIEESKDYWLVYEVGSHSLSKHLFDVKGEFFKGERIYHVSHQAFFKQLKSNFNLLKVLLKKLAEIFQVLSYFNFVHADIKPDNILVNYDGREILDVKLIDFGSAFSFGDASNIQASTPEYLAPEVLEYLENRNQQSCGNLCKKLQPWSYDIWSLGAILLEIMTGFPLWLSLKGRIETSTGKSIVGMGLLGVQGREGKKILLKQQAIMKNISSTLKKYDCFGLDQNEAFMDLLYGMLEPNPLCRISPEEILQHPFIKDIN